MAVPAAASDVRAESRSFDSVTVTWADNSDNETGFKVQRAPFGGSFATIATTAADVETYTDDTVAEGTRYEYKIVATNGDGDAAASNTVNVVVQVCEGDVGHPSAITLPRLTGERQQSDELNSAMQKIEEVLARRDMGIQDCLICPSNGAVVLDCSDACQHFTVTVTEDITSISIVGCENAPLSIIEFVVPAGASRRICGFPIGFGFEGGECARSYGAGSYFMRFFGTRVGPRLDVADIQTLAVACHSDDGSENASCTYDCSNDSHAHFRVTGGLPPYSISGVDGLGNSIPAGAFRRIGGLLGDRFSLRLYKPAMLDVAYRLYRIITSCTAVVGCIDECTNPVISRTLLRQEILCDGSVGLCTIFASAGNCADIISSIDTCGLALDSICFGSGCGSTDIGLLPETVCNNPAGLCTRTCNTIASIEPFLANPTYPSATCQCEGAGYICDKRTQSLIDNGCAACDLLDGSTITITDALGITAAKVLVVTA